MKTKFFRILVAVLVVGLAMSCSKSKKEQITVNIGTQTVYFEVMIAQEKGFFAEELAPLNAKVEVATFPSGPPQIEALAAKSLDFALVGDQPALQAISSGIPVKIIAGISDGTENMGLVARKDSGIKTVKDIKGKKIASPAGTNAYLMLIMFLEKEGLTFDDIEYVNLAIGSINASLINGNVDGAVAWGPVFSDPPEEEGLVKVHSGAGYKRNVNIIVARNEFIEKNPDITVGVLRALQKAAKWYVNNYDETIEIVAKWTGIERDVHVQLSKVLVTLLNLDSTTQDAVLSSADLLYKSDIIAEQLTSQQIFDLKFQERAGIETFPGWGADRADRIIK
jgi:aliphatic sulfonates family ABC transporter substrate-binding protein